MSRVIQTTVYQFDELSDRAKEKAREWYREGAFDYDWWDSVYEDAGRIAELLGIELRDGPRKGESAIYFSGFSSQGDGACFEANIRPRADAIAAVKDYAPVDEKLHGIAADFQAVAEMTRGLIVARVRHHGNYSHEYMMDFDFDYPDEPEDEPLANDVRSQAEELLTEAARDFARWIYRTLESQYDYLCSAESVDEMMAANEYEFTEDGDRA